METNTPVSGQYQDLDPKAQAELLAAWLRTYGKIITENADLLTDLDRQIGDADHGSNMKRGMDAVVELLAGDFASPSDLLKAVGMKLVSTVGGASGPLYGTFFMRMAMGWKGFGTAEFGQALRAGVAGVQVRGKAVAGEKTMLDCWLPALETFEQEANVGANLHDALVAMSKTAQKAAEATIPLIATKGRASYLGERSAGVQDPGATSTNLLIQAGAEVL